MNMFAQTEAPSTKFEKGDRVVITKGGDDIMGRHGTVIEMYRLVSQSIMGGAKEYSAPIYRIKSDAGSEISCLRDEELTFEAEVGEPPVVYPDPFSADTKPVPVLPARCYGQIGYCKKGAQEALNRAKRARKPEMKRKHTVDASNWESRAEKWQQIWDEWAANHPNPESLIAITGEPKPKPEPSPTSEPQPAKPGAIAIKHNQERNRIDLHFASKPSESQMQIIKHGMGFKAKKYGNCFGGDWVWINRYSELTWKAIHKALEVQLPEAQEEA